MSDVNLYFLPLVYFSIISKSVFFVVSWRLIERRENFMTIFFSRNMIMAWITRFWSISTRNESSINTRGLLNEYIYRYTNKQEAYLSILRSRRTEEKVEKKRHLSPNALYTSRRTCSDLIVPNPFSPFRIASNDRSERVL
jgi:hypothetical protein